MSAQCVAALTYAGLTKFIGAEPPLDAANAPIAAENAKPYWMSTAAASVATVKT